MAESLKQSIKKFLRPQVDAVVSTSVNLLKWLTNKQPERGYLFGGLVVAHRWIETRFSLNSRLNSLISTRMPQQQQSTLCWPSEFYIIFVIVLAVIAYYLATPISEFQWLMVITVLWPVYRINEVLIFLVGWVFVHEKKIHSIQRSLFTFILNMIELSLLFGTLEVSIGSGMPQSGKLIHFFDGFVSIATIARPNTTISIQCTIEVFRLFISLVLVLVVVGSLVGGILRGTEKCGKGL